jgi:hypothetical protein
MQGGKKKLGEVNVVGQNSPPNWSPGDVLIIYRKDGGKIFGGTYLLDCGSNGRYRVQGPGDSPGVATNSLAVGVLNVI